MASAMNLPVGGGTSRADLLFLFGNGPSVEPFLFSRFEASFFKGFF